MSPTRVLLVDDERLARRRLRTLLRDCPGVEVAGECANGPEAVAAIRARPPDLVFLDVQMPGLDGFGVIREVGPDRMPPVIFVTAHDEHALRAFEVHAVDYLLKPFDGARLARALDAARRRTAHHAAPDARLARLLDALESRDRYPTHLPVKSDAGIVPLAVDDLDWLEAAGKHVRLHAGPRSYLLRRPMRDVEAQLDPGRFIRIHRSTIVNIQSVKSFEPLFSGDFSVRMRDGTELILSRTYRPRLRERLGPPF